MPLGPWRSLRIQIVFSNSLQYHLLNGVIDKALTFKGSNPGFGNGTLSKKVNFPFLMRIHLQLLSLKQVKVQDDMHGVFHAYTRGKMSFSSLISMEKCMEKL